MILNHIKVAWRNLMKYKFISFINLFGLTVGLTCCLLILTYIVHELSYDQYNTHAADVYRVTRSFNTSDGNVSLHLGSVAPPAGPLLKSEFPDILQQTTLLNPGNAPLRYGEKKFNESQAFFADENLGKVFTINVVKGNSTSSLAEPFSVMLTEEIAQKYFGTEDPLNKLIRLNNQFNFKVTGIYKAFPSNAHMHPAMLLSFASLNDTALYGANNLRHNWYNNSFFTYLQLPPHYPVQHLEARLPAFLDKYLPRDNNGMLPSKGSSLHLQPLTDIHLKSHLDAEAEENGDIKRVYIFSVIALFILLIACINYMNLSTARSTLRAREIGIRKVVGASKKELMMQFLSESVILCFMALLLAVVLLQLSLPLLGKISGDTLSVRMLFKWQILVPTLLAPFAVGLLAGMYPALFMAAFQPVKTLKGLFKPGSESVSFRKVLVTAQFAISIILIITTMVVYSQLHYMADKSLGFDKAHIVAVRYNSGLNKNFQAFRTELLAQEGIRELTRASRIPSGRLLDNSSAKMASGDSTRVINLDIKYVLADYKFVPTFGIPLAAGRNFSEAYGADSSNYLLNETAVRLIGWKTPQDAIGQTFIYGGSKGTVIGVTRDYNFESLHQKIQPLVITPKITPMDYSWVAVKIAGVESTTAMNRIESVWKKYLPDEPFSYTFLDERFNTLYLSESRQQTIFTMFSCIAIFIASLGLLGLSAFTITQRMKEIGVRKVLGANTGSIVLMISKDFLKLVFVAALVAFPVAWYAMHQWLQAFAYRIGMPWYMFGIAAVLAAFIALATVGLQAAKAALNNPVKSLRSE